MALSLNNYAKYGTTWGSIVHSMMNSQPFAAGTGFRSVQVYLSTAAYGSFNSGVYGTSTGRAIDYVSGSSSTIFTRSGNNIVFSASGGSPQVTPSASGTLAWFSISDSAASTVIISDSITTIGGGGILQVSSLNVTSGSPIIMTFSLSLT